ncbi:DENN domain-containing protein 4C isoform X2 [Nematostella vectensis]|uniref:DENN domain-containing protein 4C isoform X2 n=1 Tax=Nematostella vectensis TaxID=45351 RepID=UPI002077042F|nr:DENN domain-containing protein 4C isoform X2 [Nematostella vectensis]
MDNRDKPQRVADYFVVAGLGENSKPTDIDKLGEEVSSVLEPITDLAVIFKSLGERPPPGYEWIEKSPAGFPADLNHGSIRQPSCFLCYKRGSDKPPLTDIGVLYEGKDRLMSGCDIITNTPYGRPANVNNSGGSRTYITYRRASQQMAHTSLAVTEICVIVASKGEKPPHAFCIIERNLNKGMVGSDVYLCYRKSLSRAKCITYHADILSRFPEKDYEGFPLPEAVPMFCLPLGAIIECWPEKCQHPLPLFSTFVLTGASGQKIYGAAVTFFEQLPEEKVTEEMRVALKLNDQNPNLKSMVAHTNKCICILSHWPFFEAFKKFLSQLYRISVSAQQIPIERYIANMMLDVPFPSPQRPRILIEMTRYEPFEISQLYHSPLPVSGASYSAMLRHLGPDNCLLLFYLILTEHKILIHSLRPALLTSVAEALTNVLFPFTWQCPYIPLCPVALNDVLCAPCPFIIGIDSRYFDQYDPPDDVTSVDLDTIMISQALEIKPSASWKSLPKKPGKVLRDRLMELYYQLYQLYHKEKEAYGVDITETAIELAPLDHDTTHSRKRLALEVSIQEAFLRFMAVILKGYGSYLKPITSRPTQETCDVTSLFDLQGFLKSRPSSHQKFFQQLTITQMFSRFIEQRSFVTSQDALLAFFDECQEKLDSPKPLIEVDESSTRGGQRTYVVTPPDANIMDKGKIYVYPTFPKLDTKLFERDNQATPVGRPVMTPPLSPVGRRTKQERAQSILSAKKNAGSPVQWARCLLAECYSLWFIHLPAYVKCHHNKAKALHFAYEILCKMPTKGVKLTDEVCFRVFMQLCGQFGHPALAVKVLFEMKTQGLTPNAVTYGYYNRAVMEGKWPSNTTSSHMWNKLRNFFAAVHEFRKLGLVRHHAREGSLSPTSLNSDEDLPDSPRMKGLLRRPGRPRTPTREEEHRLLSADSDTPGVTSPASHHGGHHTPGTPLGIRGRRVRTTSEISNLSETADLDTSLTSIDGAGMSLSFRSRRLNYGRTISETSISAFSDGSRHDTMFINASNEGVDQSEPYEDTTGALDDIIFGLPPGLQPDTALEAQLCSCYQCVKCGRFLYDEEIMAGWTADDSNLNTSCTFCTTQQVASITVKIKDYRNCFSSRPSSDLTASLNSLGSPDMAGPGPGSTNPLPQVMHSSRPLIGLEDDDDTFDPVSKSVPKTIEASFMMNRQNSPPMSMAMSSQTSNPVPIRRPKYSVSAPSSASASPTGSFHGSPRMGGLFPRVRSSNSTCSYGSNWFVTRPPEERDSITVAYVSPLVLRKELENMLDNDGDAALQNPDIVHQKDIIFWNMMWIFKRLELPSHLPELILPNYPGDRNDKFDERRSTIGSQVLMSTSWDSDRQDCDFVPMYVLWNSPSDHQITDKILTSRSVMQSVVAHIQINDVDSPITILLDERNRQRSLNPHKRWSVYRELLFLSLTACGSEHIDRRMTASTESPTSASWRTKSTSTNCVRRTNRRPRG